MNVMLPLTRGPLAHVRDRYSGLAGLPAGTALATRAIRSQFEVAVHRSAFVLLLLTVAPTLAAAENPPATHSDAVEIWVQPLGSIIYGPLTGTGSVGGAYVSAGVNIRLPHRWELVLEGTYQSVPTSQYYDYDSYASVWQFWVSVGALRFFQTGRPHDGFFVGPKLVGTYQQFGPCFGAECPTGWAYAQYFAGHAGGTLTITFEAGYRFQFGHFVLSVIFPSFGFGYGWNAFIAYPDVNFSGSSGFAMSFDFNLLRVGVSF